MRLRHHLVLVSTVAALLGACSANPPQNADAGQPPVDAGVIDAGETDAGAVDAGVPEDAGVDAGSDAGPQYDLSCLGAPLPTTAPATVTLSGTAYELTMNGTAPVADAGITFELNDGGMIGSSTSLGDGTFSVSASTGGAPVSGFLGVRKAGLRDTEFHPAPVVAADQAGLTIFSMSNTTLTAFETFAGITQDASNGIVFASVVDCGGAPLSGAVIDAQQGGQSVGQAWSVPSASFDNTTIFFNVPPGPITLVASFQAMGLRSLVVESRPSVLTEAIVRP